MENCTTESDGRDTTLKMTPGRLQEIYEMLRNCLKYGGSNYDARLGKVRYALV